MSERTATRRTVLEASAAAITAAVLPAAATAQTPEWTSVETPTENTLHDVVETDAGAFAVGGGGIVLERTGDGWEKVLDGGPTGNGNDLYGADVTDDGTRLWFVGASGAIGAYDVETGDLNDYSAPMDVTNNFNDVAVTGEAGSANAYVAGDSGKVYYSFENGESGSWDEVTPGSGAGIQAIDFYDDRAGHLVDGNQSVFATADGTTWEKAGIADADHSFYGVDADGSDDVRVSGGGGTVFHWDGGEWIRSDTGDADLRDVEVDGDDGYVVGSGGAVFTRESDEWARQETPTGENLKAVVDAETPIALGAAGTVIER